jgi:hypothetical protein
LLTVIAVAIQGPKYGNMYFNIRIAMIVLPEKERNTKHQQI